MTTQAIVRRAWLPAAAEFAADWLSLAAAPVFAVMAVLATLGGSHDVLCSVSARPMNGMAWMYALMSIRHAAPWLKLLSSVSTSRR